MDLSLEGLKLAQVPLIHQLFKEDIYLKAISQSLSRPKIGSHFQTVVTPNVYAFSIYLFQQHFKTLSPHKQERSKLYKYPMNIGEIHGASPIIKWIGNPSVSSVYTAVRIGKTIYKVLYLS